MPSPQRVTPPQKKQPQQRPIQKKRSRTSGGSLKSKPARKRSRIPIQTKKSAGTSPLVYIFIFIALAGVVGFGIYKNSQPKHTKKIILLSTEDDNSNIPESPVTVKKKNIPPKNIKKIRPTNPVAAYGPLKTSGKFITDSTGNPVVLHGMSFFHCDDGEKYKNEECIKWLIKDWHCNIIRFPILPGVKGKYGFAGDPAGTFRKLDTIINACIRNGIYIIVDFHGGKNPMDHLDDAKKLFSGIAKKYGNKPNIIYEVFNEPYGPGVTWDDVIRPYFKTVIKEIRKYDKDNLILVGTPEFDLNIDQIIPNPLSEFKNIAYVAHFYAATHKAGNRMAIQRVLDAGLPVYISEFGTCECSGDGKLDKKSVDQWMEFLDKNKIGWCNWSVHEKNETASILKPSASGSGNWKFSDLTRSGNIIRNLLRNYK
jgi:endoglucanase